MDVILTIKSETIHEWKVNQEALWFYLEDVPISKKDFSIVHADNGFVMQVHQYVALRAKEALKSLIDRGRVRVTYQPLLDNPEIRPVKKRKKQKKIGTSEKISNIKIKSRDDVCIGKTK